jgi:hypothetical protein
MAYICESCREVLDPEDEVVAAAELLDPGAPDSSGLIVGLRALWRARHWRDELGYRKVAEGTLRDLV